MKNYIINNIDSVNIKCKQWQLISATFEHFLDTWNTLFTHAVGSISFILFIDCLPWCADEGNISTTCSKE